ncbi:hypothetical protein [Commensalibacter papalotli (ex Servin-Garciduenas et al. 2014)]|uniref:Uncharacterized protein n=1 Tax=Commensalibacter papalotli (ex Servin-Garciduenas et al. 2014) TaxID=1208583 RepID=W7E0C5_9PROT|nr:hypothetical protein [Commensalibacter papalotli (ex Servin-Garciduenas et al. 2014)]EUK18399.1 hypothetical protein COMX_01585 [Commensalibacter papalotli (ex Servin-Garciduenas et al. 2014)]
MNVFLILIMTAENDIELLGVICEDQDFIAHARQDIPKSIEEIKLLRWQF